ncbi:MAG: hypothetical protein ACWGNV_00430 [Bacteroidales bacterium]
MKKLAIIAVICVSALAARGQDVIWKMAYEVAFPLSDTKEFADQVSWRGASIDFDRFVNDNMAVGLGVSWSVFLEKESNSDYMYNDMLIHGTQVRYINNIPMLARFSWYQPTGDFDTYFTAGVGTVWQENRREIGLWAFKDSYWQFALSPEVGIIFPIGRSYLTAKVKYMQGFKTSDAPALSYLGIGVGFAW